MTEQEIDRLIHALEVIGQALTDRVTLERERLNIEHPNAKPASAAEVFKAKYDRNKAKQESQDDSPIQDWAKIPDAVPVKEG